MTDEISLGPLCAARKTVLMFALIARQKTWVAN